MSKQRIQIITILLAGVGLIVSSACEDKHPVKKAEWRIEASKAYKGMTGMGYATICPHRNPPPKEVRFLV